MHVQYVTGSCKRMTCRFLFSLFFAKMVRFPLSMSSDSWNDVRDEKSDQEIIFNTSTEIDTVEFLVFFHPP